MYITNQIFFLLGLAFLHNTGSNVIGNSTTGAKIDLGFNAEVNAASIYPEIGSMKCGEILQGPSGTVSYKPYSIISENERCVWTIRTTNALRYRFALTNLGIPNSVIITTVSSTGSLSHSVPAVASSNANIVTGTLLVITFYSTNVTGRGFSLTYDTYAYGGLQGDSSTVVVAASNIGHIKHPLNATTYANQDVSVFAFVPSCINQVGKSTQVIYIKDGLEGTSCIDRLFLYRLDVTLGSNNKWRSMGQICGGVDSEVITSPDLLLIIFSSDSSIVSTGFHLYSSNI